MSARLSKLTATAKRMQWAIERPISLEVNPLLLYWSEQLKEFNSVPMGLKRTKRQIAMLKRVRRKAKK